jgi:hypothetical protein
MPAITLKMRPTSGGRSTTNNVSAAESEMRPRETGGTAMLWTILVILLVLWLLGVVTSYTMGGLIHLLLVVAVVILVVRLVSGRRVI